MYISITDYWLICTFFIPLQMQFEFPPDFPDRHPTEKLDRVMHVLVHYSENNGFCFSLAIQKTQK